MLLIAAAKQEQHTFSFLFIIIVVFFPWCLQFTVSQLVVKLTLLFSRSRSHINLEFIHLRIPPLVICEYFTFRKHVASCFQSFRFHFQFLLVISFLFDIIYSTNPILKLSSSLLSSITAPILRTIA